jgi:heat shock protein HtpX
VEPRIGHDLWLTVRMAVALVLATAPYVLLEVILVAAAIAAFRDGEAVGALFALLFAVVLPFVVWMQVVGSGHVALGELRARPPTDAQSARLEPLVARVAGQADLPAPVLRMIGSKTPNALAIASARTVERRVPGTKGRSRVGHTIVLTTGLLRTLEPAEIEAVVAHELTHLANHDAAVLTYVAGPALFARHLWKDDPFRAVFVLVWIWPVSVFSVVLTRIVSRYREYTADRGAALVTGAPEALIGALLKLNGAAPPKADLRGGLAARAFWIVPPSRPRFALLSEHPPLERRVRRLERLAADLRDG